MAGKPTFEIAADDEHGGGCSGHEPGEEHEPGQGCGGGHEGDEGDPDPIYLGNGNDIWIASGEGGNGRKIVSGGNGDDTVVAANGHATLYGDNGDDYLEKSGMGKAELFGGNGDDVLIAGDMGPQLLDGGRGNDVLIGGAGNDILIGGQGNDTLEGGGGGDTFVFEGQFGSDVITDFECAQGEGGDKIDLSALGITGLDDLVGHVSETEVGTLIALQGGTITLNDFDAGQLTADCFVFA